MRGNLFALVGAAFGAGLLLRGLSTARPSNPAESTQAVSGILDVLTSTASLAIMLVAIGVIVTWLFAGTGAGGGM